MSTRVKTGKELPPFIPLFVMGVVDATPDEQAAIVAIQYLNWAFGDEAQGLEMIFAVLNNPHRKELSAEDAAFQKQISLRNLKRALASLRKREWLYTTRAVQPNGYRSPMQFHLTLPEITFSAARDIVVSRMGEQLQSKFSPTKKNQGQPDLFTPPVTAQEAPPSSPGATQDPPAAAKPKTSPGKHQDQDEFWRHAQATWKEIFKTDLIWPKGGTFQADLTRHLEALGLVEIKRRWDNMLADPWAQSKSLRNFVYDPDRWINLRTKTKGPANGRAFIQPESRDWTPSGH